MKLEEYGKENNNIIVMLHGANFVHCYGRQYSLANSFHIIVPHIMGFGDEAGRIFYTDTCCAELVNMIRSLNKKVLLVGFSLGAQLAFKLVSEYPELFYSAIIVSPWLNKTESSLAEVMKMNEKQFASFKKKWLCNIIGMMNGLPREPRKKFVHQKLISDKEYLADSLADISHQIRTPLTSINLLVERLSASGLTDECRHQLTNELYGLLDRIDWLITTLLKISKLDAGTVQFNKETVSMETLINKSCAPLLIPIELRGQELIIRAEGNFYGDPAWTSEAVGNIVKNCMEHTPDGGKIEIEAAENALYSEIIIKDNGTGISPEDLPHIFERFYKGKDSDGKSFGIGLALSRMIIAGQKGTVKAENRKNAGAMFTLRFYKGTV